MNVELFRKKICSIKAFEWLYRNVYLNFIHWKRHNVRITDFGSNNSIRIPKSTTCANLLVTFKGNNNTIRIGENCSFLLTNSIFIQGDNNVVEIGDKVIFDQNVSIVVAEGSKCAIGADCIFANGVIIRTSDQHSIFDSSNKRLNPPKDVIIGDHVWLGAYVTVMKGAKIGNGSVIGMKSMVISDIPDNNIAVGIPAKVKKTNINWHM